MPPLTASRRRYGLRTISGYRRGITQGGAAFPTEFSVQLDGCSAFWAGGEERRPAIRTEFAPFPIFAAAFRTASRPFPLRPCRPRDATTTDGYARARIADASASDDSGEPRFDADTDAGGSTRTNVAELSAKVRTGRHQATSSRNSGIKPQVLRLEQAPLVKSNTAFQLLPQNRFRLLLR